MGKITVKHYLNKDLKPKKDGNNIYYPVYVQVIANRKNLKFKSNFDFFDGYLSESSIRDKFVKSLLGKESNNLKRIITYLNESNKTELINPKTLKKYSENLWDLLNRNFGILFKKEAQKLNTNYPEIMENVFYYDVKQIIEFTQSEIESEFSEEYFYCRIGMSSLYNDMLRIKNNTPMAFEYTVFDFLYSDASIVIKEVIKKHHFFDGDEEKEHQKVITELKKLIQLS